MTSEVEASQIPAEPASEDLLHLTDAATLKALSHVARLVMLMKMRLDGSVTATEVSELVGLSPSACSWHLRALAKAGLAVKVAGDDARQTRWAAASRGHSFEPTSPTDPEYRSAASLLSQQHLSHTIRVHQAWLDRAEAEETVWQQAVAHSDDIIWVTPEELLALGQETIDRLRAFRRPEPADRPVGARQVSATFMAVPFEIEWLAEQLRSRG